MVEEFTTLPDDLPQPIDDGESDHLLGMTISNTILPSTKGPTLDLSKICSRYKVLYFFPMIAVPGEHVPSSEWNIIPGARGCTPQNISISDHDKDLQRYDTISIWISTQPISELIKASSLRKLSQPLLENNQLLGVHSSTKIQTDPFIFTTIKITKIPIVILIILFLVFIYTLLLRLSC